ncbi:polysaccharide biosynthesis C-terminal domain-containing protein [Jhaorihella thermophila]|uniref:oligosaccharide flippase family protein n=1 Tax=Jhaorihella thermophila TaxID=488547 RepID=UPI00360A77AC
MDYVFCPSWVGAFGHQDLWRRNDLRRQYPAGSGLGASGYGAYAFLFAIVTLAALPTQFGLPDLVVRETSRAATAETPGLMFALWRWAHSFVCATSLMVIIAVWLWLSMTDETGNGIAAANFIALILIPLISLSNLRAAMLRGLGHDLLGQLPEHAIRPTLFAIVLLIMLLLPGPPLSVANAFVAQSIAVGLATAFGMVQLWHLAPRATRVTPTSRQKAGWYRAAFAMGSISGLVLINNSVDIIMLGLWKSDADVGHYRLASTVGALITLGLQTMNMYAMPHLTRSVVTGKKADLARVVQHSTQLSFGFSMIALAGILVLGEPALAFVFGRDFSDAYPVLLVLAAGHITNAFFGPSHTVLMMAGQERVAAFLTGLGTVANVGLNFLLIPTYGPIGAAVASAVAIVVTKVAAFILVWRMHKVLSWPFPKQIFGLK